MVAIVTTAFTLACVGIFLLLYVNLRAAAGWLQDDIKIMVYLDDRLASDSVTEVEQNLRGDRAVASLLFISKEQALGEFKAQFPSESHLLDGLGQNPLPASFVVALSPSFRSPDAVMRWADRVRQVAGVSKVDYNQDWIDALATDSINRIGCHRHRCHSLGRCCDHYRQYDSAHTIRPTGRD